MIARDKVAAFLLAHRGQFFCERCLGRAVGIDPSTGHRAATRIARAGGFVRGVRGLLRVRRESARHARPGRAVISGLSRPRPPGIRALKARAIKHVTWRGRDGGWSASVDGYSWRSASRVPGGRPGSPPTRVAVAVGVDLVAARGAHRHLLLGVWLVQRWAGGETFSPTLGASSCSRRWRGRRDGRERHRARDEPDPRRTREPLGLRRDLADVVAG